MFDKSTRPQVAALALSLSSIGVSAHAQSVEYDNHGREQISQQEDDPQQLIMTAKQQTARFLTDKYPSLAYRELEIWQQKVESGSAPESYRTSPADFELVYSAVLQQLAEVQLGDYSNSQTDNRSGLVLLYEQMTTELQERLRGTGAVNVVDNTESITVSNGFRMDVALEQLRRDYRQIFSVVNYTRPDGTMVLHLIHPDMHKEMQEYYSALDRHDSTLNPDELSIANREATRATMKLVDDVARAQAKQLIALATINQLSMDSIDRLSGQTRVDALSGFHEQTEKLAVLTAVLHTLFRNVDIETRLYAFPDLERLIDKCTENALELGVHSVTGFSAIVEEKI